MTLTSTQDINVMSNLTLQNKLVGWGLHSLIYYKLTWFLVDVVKKDIDNKN